MHMHQPPREKRRASNVNGTVFTTVLQNRSKRKPAGQTMRYRTRLTDEYDEYDTRPRYGSYYNVNLIGALIASAAPYPSGHTQHTVPEPQLITYDTYQP